MVRSVGELPCSDAILPMLVRLEPRYLLQQRHYSNQHCCRRDRPPIVRTVGKLPCSGVILPIFVRLVLSVHMGTATAMQRAALL